MDPFQELIDGLLEAESLGEQFGSPNCQESIQFALDYFGYDEAEVRNQLEATDGKR